MNNSLDRWIEEKLQDTASPKKIKTPSLEKENKVYQKKKRPKHTFHKKGQARPQANQKKPQHTFHKKSQTSPHAKPRRQFHHKQSKHGKVRIIPLGGLDEVGKNMMIIEYNNEMIIIDMGFQFPEEDMLGVDYVIPDVSWLEKKANQIKGVILNHGHLDHIGGIPYILPRLQFPQVYGTKLTLGLVEKRIEEFGLKKDTILNEIHPDDTLKLGPFTCRFFRVNHSIPDGVGIVIETPEGTIVHSGDFKFDETPADQVQADIGKLAELGRRRNVSVLFSDSTNATVPGHTVSEKEIGENLDKIIRETPGRIIIASFASLIGRIQQVLNSAQKWKRKVFVSGRSLIDNIAIAERLGFIKVPKGLIQDVRFAERGPGKNALILTTGSQGEAVSALTRISLGSHKHVKIKKGDTVVISASPIIGNERAIYTVIDNLTKLGARVIHNKIMDVHTSGHGCKDDLKMMLNFVKPHFFVPIHGQYYMRNAHKEIAHEMGVRPERAMMINNGDILELKNGRVAKSKEKAETNYILVDGYGMGDSGSRVIMERQTLAQNGVLVVTLKVHHKTKRMIKSPHIETRGFIYLGESEKIVQEIKSLIKKKYDIFLNKNPRPGLKNIREYITSSVDKYTHRKLARRPLILPIVVEV
jgi:ribonuclease J